METTNETRQAGLGSVSNTDADQIRACYRAYCDACQSGQLEKVPSFWSLPALFAVDGGGSESEQQVLDTPDEIIKLYSTLFGPSTGVDKTVIDSSEVTFFGDKLATISTALRHLAGDRLHDRQYAIYGCRKVNGTWIFFSHVSQDVTE